MSVWNECTNTHMYLFKCTWLCYISVGWKCYQLFFSMSIRGSLKIWGWLLEESNVVLIMAARINNSHFVVSAHSVDLTERFFLSMWSWLELQSSGDLIELEHTVEHSDSRDTVMGMAGRLVSAGMLGWMSISFSRRVRVFPSPCGLCVWAL